MPIAAAMAPAARVAAAEREYQFLDRCHAAAGDARINDRVLPEDDAAGHDHGPGCVMRTAEQPAGLGIVGRAGALECEDRR